MRERGKIKASGQEFVTALAVFTTFLLPVKFGSIVAVPEVAGFYPDSLFAWLIISWPVYFFPVLVSVILLSTIIFFPLPAYKPFKPAWITMALWLAIPLVATIGFINASVLDFPIIETLHLSSLAAWAMAIWLILTNRPDYRKYFYLAIVSGLAVTLLLSLQQYFAGFQETREFILAREKRTGMVINADMNNILEHPRLFGPFGICNSLAAHLLLTLPISLAMLWHWCRKIDPPNISRTLFMLPFGGVALFVLYQTGSRAALLAMIAAGALFTLLLPIRTKIKLSALVLGLLSCVGGVIAMKYYGRTFASITVRIDYLLRSAEIFAAHPFAGSGWGDFFHDYMRLKQVFHKEAPHMPHNIIMSFASQTGLIGLLTIICALLYPLWHGARQLLNQHLPMPKIFTNRNAMLILGLTAWTLHAMADINLQIPATMATMILMVMLLTIPGSESQRDSSEQKIATLPRVQTWAWKGTAIILAAASIYGGLHMIRFDYAMTKLIQATDIGSRTQEQFFRIAPDKIVADLEQCNRIAPYSPYPYRVTASFMAQRGYLKRAEQLYLEAIKRSPERPSFYFQLYLLNRVAHNRPRAIKYLTKAIKMFPKNERYLAAAVREGLIKLPQHNGDK